MWYYAAAIFALALIAEAVGLGGVPAPAVTLENTLFVVLVLAALAIALKRFTRR